MLQTTHNKIQRAFSASAKRYDLFSSLHREIADKLFIQVTNSIEPRAILDVGCGTGYLTGKLKEHFFKAKVIGVDFSEGMLEEARAKQEGIAWVWADSHKLPFTDGSFDAVVSNLAYQWAEDLSLSFSEARRVLTPDGILAYTLFGFHTCQELFQSLEEARPGALQISRLPDELKVREALTAGGFNNFKIEQEQIKTEFGSMQELMLWLKSIGANHLPREGYIGPEAIAKAASIYKQKFSYHQGVVATFEVIRVYVKK